MASKIHAQLVKRRKQKSVFRRYTCSLCRKMTQIYPLIIIREAGKAVVAQTAGKVRIQVGLHQRINQVGMKFLQQERHAKVGSDIASARLPKRLSAGRPTEAWFQSPRCSLFLPFSSARWRGQRRLEIPNCTARRCDLHREVIFLSCRGVCKIME